MKRILVTGLIGSGKSEVCRYFSSLGYPVYECDSRMKSLYRDESGLLERCEKAVGVGFPEFSSVIFSDSCKLAALEAAAFPSLVRNLVEWEKGQASSIVFIESATAWSKPQFDGLYDSVLLIRADESIRFARNPNASLRTVCQGEPCDADYIIENNSDLASLKDAADKFLKEIQ